MHFIGLDIHKKTISYCVKDVSGKVLSEGTVPASRIQLNEWMKTLPAPWTVAMEATMFTGWIYDHLLPHAAAVKVAHPLMLRAIAAAKKKNDRIDASKICDCLRCDFLPECHMVSTEVRERRRTLRYRKLLVRQNVQLRNKVSQMLMESGVVYNKQKLHKVGYFKELMETNQDIGRALRPLLTICCETIVRIGKTESALIRSLRRDPLLQARVERLMTIPAVGPITALTWVLEVDDVARFHSVKQAVSYCGLCGAERSSAETIKRMPISKQRNKHLQSVLIEAAKLGPRLSPDLALIYATEKQKGHANRASIAVARKLVAYLLAVDRSGREFVGQEKEKQRPEAATKNKQVHPTRPARSRSCRLGDGAHAPKAPFEMFRDWQVTLTQSSVTVGNNPIQRMDVWFCVIRRNRAERLNREAMNRLKEEPGALPSAVGNPRPT
jgi:transposase